jgi:hypothetical protein
MDGIPIPFVKGPTGTAVELMRMTDVSIFIALNLILPVVLTSHIATQERKALQELCLVCLRRILTRCCVGRLGASTSTLKHKYGDIKPGINRQLSLMSNGMRALDSQSIFRRVLEFEDVDARLKDYQPGLQWAVDVFQVRLKPSHLNHVTITIFTLLRRSRAKSMSAS